MSSVGNAVFLSYASQDADAARRICDALRAADVEVWFDQSELRGGDAWDQKIRRQIKECALFVPIISATTQSRHEGYFRLEWRLADQRTHLMGKSRAFLVPACIDDTRDTHADVPDSFVAVHWTRLPQGETSAAFCERVKTLLGGEEVARAFQPLNADQSNVLHGLKARGTPIVRGGRKSWIISALAAVVGAIALAIWQPWKKSPLSEAKSAAPISEARQLTLKARALIDDDLLAGRENYRLAEELSLRATSLDPADGEAWATLARISLAIIDANYDRSSQRREAARSQTERALRLAPESVEAGLAMALYSISVDQMVEAEARLRALLARVPSDPRVALALTQTLINPERAAEASAMRLNHPALGERYPRALMAEAGNLRISRRYVEAEALVDRTQAIAPSLNGYRIKLLLLGTDWGDLEAAKAYAETLPPQVMQEDLFVGLVTLLWLRLGEPDKALRLLERVPREFFEDSRQFVPKGYLAGRALGMSGRMAAAESEWKGALAVVEKRLASESNHRLLLRWKALLLGLSRQGEEAERIWKLYRELSGPSTRVLDALENSLIRAELLLSLDRREEAIAEILAEPRWVWPQESMPVALTSLLVALTNLQHAPWLAPLREDPRVRAIVSAGVARRNEVRQTQSRSMTRLDASGQTPSAFNTRLQAPNSEPLRPVADAKSVAVLAFKNLSDDQGSEYFSDGISEELANVLGRVPGLRVAGSTSAFSFKGKAVPVPEIARQLGVSHVVEGSVRRSGNRVKISAKLINAADGFQVWASEPIDREVKDSLAVQDEIAALIAKSLSLKLGASSPAARASLNPEAVRLYLEGREAWTRRGTITEGGNAAAESLFRQAVVLEPDFARAHASLAVSMSRAYDRAQGSGAEDAPSRKAQAYAATDRALALDPTLAEAHVARARLQWIDHQDATAEESFRHAIALNPSYATAHHWHGIQLFVAGRFDQGLAELAVAMQLDPLSSVAFGNHAGFLRDVRRWPEALASAQRTIELFPEYRGARIFKVDALIGLGRYAVARESWQADEGAAWTQSLEWKTREVIWLAQSGDGTTAARMAEPILAEPANARHGREMLLIHVALGRIDEAFAYVERNNVRFTTSRFFLVTWLDPVFDSVRDDPRFLRILEKAGMLGDYRELWARYLAWTKKVAAP